MVACACLLCPSRCGGRPARSKSRRDRAGTRVHIEGRVDPRQHTVHHSRCSKLPMTPSSRSTPNRRLRSAVAKSRWSARRRGRGRDAAARSRHAAAASGTRYAARDAGRRRPDHRRRDDGRRARACSPPTTENDTGYSASWRPRSASMPARASGWSGRSRSTRRRETQRSPPRSHRPATA